MSEVIPPKGLIVTHLAVNTPAQRNQSVWTRRARKTGLPGAELWQAAVSIPETSTEVEEREWRSFLFGLGGVLNWFKLPLPCQTHIGPEPKIAAGGVLGGYQQPLKGMEPNTTILYVGQFLTISLPVGRPRTVMLTQDLRTNGAGEAVATFRPSLGQIPVTDTTVETSNPFIPVCCVTDVVGISWGQGVGGASLDLIEDMGP